MSIKQDVFLVHLFRTAKNFYIFDVNTNGLLNVNESIYNDLKSYIEGQTNILTDEIKELQKNGYLLPKQDYEMIHPMDENLEDILERKLGSIILQLTQNCNLRCKYCIYSGSYINRVHSNKRMNEETALKALDLLINKSIDASILYVGFYGGEPLLEFELIKKCVEYLKENAIGKSLKFNITTNATLLSPEIIEFLYKNKFNITISLDGPKEMHNNNRVFSSNGCGTFDSVMKNMELIKDKFPDFISHISFNAVLDPHNDFSCVNDFFSNYNDIKEFDVNTSLLSANYTKDDIKYDENYKVRYDYEIFKMFLWKLNRLDLEDVSKLIIQYNDRLTSDIYNRTKGSSSNSPTDYPSGQCIPGGERLFVDTDGNLYPCERVSEASDIMKIGTLDKGFNYDKIRKLLNVAKITENNCRNCWAFRYCTSCIAACDGIDHLSSELRLKRCKKVLSSTEDLLRDYCALRELGDNFTDNLFDVNSYIKEGDINE